jgi:hypothetical protein
MLMDIDPNLLFYMAAAATTAAAALQRMPRLPMLLLLLEAALQSLQHCHLPQRLRCLQQHWSTGEYWVLLPPQLMPVRLRRLHCTVPLLLQITAQHLLLPLLLVRLQPSLLPSPVASPAAC